MSYLINTEDGDHTHFVEEHEDLEAAKAAFLKYVAQGADEGEIAIELVTDDYEAVMYHDYETGITTTDDPTLK